MNILPIPGFAIAFISGFYLIFSSGCVGTVGGYGYQNDGYNGMDYYNTGGGYYGGGWGGNYHVGPPRGGEQHRHDDGNASAHAYRPAPASHAMPSIPSSPR